MRLRPTLGLALTVIASWLIAGPVQLGGGVTYVTTYGNSMEPGIAAGDLVLVRAQKNYEVGDAVAYRSAQLRTVVLHRIVDTDDGRYVLQGDNNSWLDLEQPTPSDVVGKQWLHIPSGGRWLQRLTSSPALGAAAFLLLSGGGAAAHTRRRRRRKDRRTMAEQSVPRLRSAAALLPSWQSAATAIAAIGLLGALVGALAWTRPTESSVTAEETTTSNVEFSYSATVRPSAAYDDTTVIAPQAVFRTLTDTVDIDFSYEGQPGTVSVEAELATASGWRTTIVLADPVVFDTTEYAGTVRLDLAALEARAKAAAAVIGVPAQNVTVSVVPRVSVGEDEFAPRLAFTLDEVALRLSGDAVLTEEHTFSVTNTATAPAALSILGHDLHVSTARTISLVAVAFAVVLAAALAVAVRLAGPAAESERIRRRHGQVLLPVAPIAIPPGRPVVDVPDVKSLVRLAERYGLLVLHWSRSGVDTYVVQDAETTYRHRIHGGGRPSTNVHASTGEGFATDDQILEKQGDGV